MQNGVSRFLSGKHFTRRLVFHAPNRRQFLSAEDAVDVQNHDELRVPLSHALDEIGSYLCADSGGRLNLVGLQVDYFLNRIRQGSDNGRLTPK